MEKPFDKDFADMMIETTKYLVENIQNCQLGYVQSDEISLLLVDYNTLETDSWFDNKVQKITSVSASMATAKFMELWNNFDSKKKPNKGLLPMFDSRVFNMPKEDVCNYMLWRQNDATRNSIQGLGQAHFSHKQMHGLSNNKVQDKLMTEKNINWNDVATMFKRGTCVVRDKSEERSKVVVDYEIPIFSQDRNYIEQYI